MSWTSFIDEHLQSVGQLAMPERLKLPRPPGAVAKFLQVVEHPQSTMAQVAETIAVDPELTARLLKVVNSCGSGLPTRIVSANQAVALLGIRRCKMLVLSAALQAVLRTSGWYAVNGMMFQAECLERALFAKYTAEALGLDSELAYATSLVQDLLLPFMMDEYPELFSTFSGEGSSIADHERNHHGWTHEHLAAMLLKNWSFPESAVAGVLTHHRAAWLLGKPDLLKSVLLPPAAAALLPDALCQEPNGVDTLLALQEALPEFDFIEIACRADDQLENSGQRWRSTPLAERLGSQAMVRVQRRSVDAWQGRSIGHYVLLRKIGEGGMGVVYLAQHTHLKRMAAVKLMKHSYLDPECRARFESEAAVTSVLQNQHTTMVYDYGETMNGAPYYVMEFVDGITLHELVCKCGSIPEARVIHFLLQTCSSLAEAHERGLVHRDIKPENIIVSHRSSSGDFIKVLDFGLATLRSANIAPQNGKQVVRGTPHYLAPEAIMTPDSIDGRSDIYALGCTAYWLLTGSIPFDGPSALKILQMHIDAEVQPLSTRLGRPMNDVLESIVMDCLAKDVSKRPQSAEQLSERLLQCVVGCGAWDAQLASQWWQTHESQLRGPFATSMDSRSRTSAGTGFSASAALVPDKTLLVTRSQNVSFSR